MLALWGVFVSRCIMRSVLVLTVSGADRCGLVERLADVVVSNHGNWEHCRMAHLAERFVGILQVSVSAEYQQDLEAALRTIDDLDVMISVADSLVSEPSVLEFGLEILGSDQPGIVRGIFSALAHAEVNVEELETKTFCAPDSGLEMFRSSAKLTCPRAVDLDSLQTELEAIAQDLLVEVRVMNTGS